MNRALSEMHSFAKRFIMNKLLALLLAVAAFGFLPSACALTIVPTFDSSITGDPNAAVMEGAINSAIQVFEADLADNATVYIQFINDPNVGLGESVTWINNYSYSSYLSALRSRASDVHDTNALSNLPNSATDPVLGRTTLTMTLALAVMMGLDSGTGNDGFDSTIHLNMSLMNLSRPPADPNKYDLAQVAEHEMDEVLGTASNVGHSRISPIDLFRYTTNLARTFTTGGDDAYFSVDGTNLLARYNMQAGADYGDWWSASGYWAPPGTPPHPQVQDAYSTPDVALDLGSNELAMLDVIGWTLAPPGTAAPGSPRLSIANDEAGQVTLSWSNNVTGFVLQETTNLAAGEWAASASGSTNPAVVAIVGAQKFYRLYYNPAAPASALALASRVRPASAPALQRDTRIYLPRKF